MVFVSFLFKISSIFRLLKNTAIMSEGIKDRYTRHDNLAISQAVRTYGQLLYYPVFRKQQWIILFGRAEMLDEEMDVMNGEEELDYRGDSDRIFFEGLLAFGRYMNLPEDYWEKEGIGWK